MSCEGDEDLRVANAGHTPGPESSPEDEDGNQGEATAEPEADTDGAPADTMQNEVDAAAAAGAVEVVPAPEVAQPPPAAESSSQSQMASKSTAQSTVGPSTTAALKQNHMALMASTQMKLPVSNVKRIVERVARPTETSKQKQGRWYKDRNYVDVKTYNWDNMSLFLDYHRQIWTPEGTIKDSCKK